LSLSTLATCCVKKEEERLGREELQRLEKQFLNNLFATFTGLDGFGHAR
jgi:hypothetical protein